MFTNANIPGVLVVALVALAGTAAAQHPARFEVADAHRIAVRLTRPDSALDLEALGARHGFAPTEARDYGPREFRVLELERPIRDRDERQALLRRLATDPEVDFATPVFTNELDMPEFPTRHVLVRFEPRMRVATQRGLLRRIPGLTIVETRFAGMQGAWRLRSSAATGTEVLAQVEGLARLPGVRWAEPDAVTGGRRQEVTPNDPLWDNCWGLRNTGQTGGVADVDMDADEAWSRETGDSSIIVVILDTGVQQNHPDLNQIAGNDFTSDASTTGGPVNACDNHGTAVAGCVSAILNNNTGTVGVAPGVRVASARFGIANVPVCSPGFGYSTSWLLNALNWADQIGARVTNNSSSFGWTQSVADKYADLRANGIVNFAATGNAGNTTIDYPASDPSVNGIGGIDDDGTIWGSSNTGAGIFAVAPSVSAQTTDRTGTDGYNAAASPAGDYSQSSGTSFASPYAAGVAALVLSVDPALTAAETATVLALSAIDYGAAGYDTTFGYGFVNARRALYHVGDTYVDDGWAGNGAYAAPYGTLVQGVGAVPTGGHLIVRSGSYAESLVISKAMTIVSPQGGSVLGQ